MRKKEREITDKATLENMLRLARVCRLGLYDGEWPYVVPVNFGYESGRLYIHSSQKGRKMDILRTQPRVGFEVDLEVEVVGGAKPCDYTAHYKSIIGYGQAVILEDEAEKLNALRVIMRHYGGPTEGFRPEVLPKTAVVRIDIVSMTGKSNPPHQDWE